MSILGDNPIHRLLLLTEKPGRWAPGALLPPYLAGAALAGWAWAAADTAATGWAVAAGLCIFSAADWALFAGLPRRGLSFGPVQPPWLALALVRVGLALALSPLGSRWPLPALAGLLLAQLCLAVLLAHGTLVEPFRVQVSCVEWSMPRLANPGAPLRIVHLSDLHVERLTPRERALPALVAGLRPDLILLTGDYLNTSYSADPAALADLRSLLEQLHAPGGVVAVWGTPEVDRPAVLRPAFAGLGIQLLEGQAVERVVAGHRLWLMGMTCTRDLEAAGATLRSLMAGAPPGALTLLLHHSPDIMPQAVRMGVDVVLSGHTHGGQWRVPGFGALWTSSRYWKRYEAGAIREGDTRLYVSRGLGLEGFGAPRARFFCRPEVVLIDLRGARPHAPV